MANKINPIKILSDFEYGYARVTLNSGSEIYVSNLKELLRIAKLLSA